MTKKIKIKKKKRGNAVRAGHFLLLRGCGWAQPAAVGSRSRGERGSGDLLRERRRIELPPAAAATGHPPVWTRNRGAVVTLQGPDPTHVLRPTI